MQPNKYRATCHHCFRVLKPGEGHLERSFGARGWIALHNSRAECDAAEIAEPCGGQWTRDDAMFQSMQADF